MTDQHRYPESMDEDLIARTLEGVRARLGRSERERAELDRVIANAQEEERLLLRLLSLRRGETTSQDDDTQPATEASGAMKDQSARLETASAKQPVVQAVIQELAAAARPVHISELMRLLRERQIPVPGAGTQANLITHLRRDARLVRPSRGMYGLAAWGLENMPPTAIRKRRKRRMRISATGRTAS